MQYLLYRFLLCQFPIRQFPLCQFLTLSIPTWSMLTKWELTKWEVDKVGIDEVKLTKWELTKWELTKWEDTPRPTLFSHIVRPVTVDISSRYVHMPKLAFLSKMEQKKTEIALPVSDRSLLSTASAHQGTVNPAKIKSCHQSSVCTATHTLPPVVEGILGAC